MSENGRGLWSHLCTLAFVPDQLCLYCGLNLLMSYDIQKMKSFQVLSSKVLIVGTWLAADKASFISLTLNVTKNSPSSPENLEDKDAEKILQVRKAQ